jgi:hypothetical protein
MLGMVACGVCSVAWGQAAIYPLPGATPVYPRTEALQISGDGSIVVGRSMGSTSAGTAWNDSGQVATILCCTLGASFTHASADGQVLAGWIIDTVEGGSITTQRPLRLERAFNIYSVFAEDVIGHPDLPVVPIGIDASGRYLLLRSLLETMPPVEASSVFDGLFRSTVQSWPSQPFAAAAMGVSPSVVVGSMTDPLQGVLWTLSGGFVPVCDLVGGCPPEQPFQDPLPLAVNASGDVLVGQASLAGGAQVAVRMSASGVQLLWPCPSGAAVDVSADGRTVVGEQMCGPVLEAMIWREGEYAGTVSGLLASAGVNLTGWMLSEARAVSDDGLTIVGNGSFQGEIRGWVAHLPPIGPVCDSIDFNNDGSVFDPTDVDAFLSVFSEGPCVPETATCNDVDFNNDGSLFDPHDIDAFLSVFSEGPCL